MATRDEFIAGIQDVDQRLDALRDEIIANGEKPLPEGSWRVRDALSHLAARANGVPRVLARVEAADNPSAASPPPQSIDDINAGQVDERSERSVEQLLDEIKEGHAAALQAAQGLDSALLERSIPMGFRPGDAKVVDMLYTGGPRHDSGHLDQVEAAIKA